MTLNLTRHSTDVRSDSRFPRSLVITTDFNYTVQVFVSSHFNSVIIITMSDNVFVTEVIKFPCLTYSRKFFTDYRLTTLIFRIRQSGERDITYTETTPHSLISLQTSTQKQLISPWITFIMENVYFSFPESEWESWLWDLETSIHH